MNDRNSRRTCLLIGASGTLGTALCSRLSGDYRITAVWRSRPPRVPTQARRFIDPLEPTAGTPDGGEVYAIESDLLLGGEIERVVELALTHMGTIDLLVNAAVHSVWGPLIADQHVMQNAKAMVDTNILLPLQMSVAVALAHWRDQPDENRRRGRNVVNVSSTAGIYVYPRQGQNVYSATKAALNILSAHMAEELAGFGVRVNVLAPNSFPSRVSTDEVVDAIVALDRGRDSGELVVLEGRLG